MPFHNIITAQVTEALSNIKLTPYWLDNPTRPPASPSLAANIHANLCVIGGGFTGLWTALIAKEQDPQLNVVLIEGERIASGATGRNGGFVSASITHGFSNGYARWPKEIHQLIKLGQQNLDGIEAAIKKYNIDCDFIRAGELKVATENYQVADLLEEIELGNQHGEAFEFLETEQIQQLINSPTFIAAQLDQGCAIVNPAHLAWGLQRACLQAGVHIFENTKALGLSAQKTSVTVKTASANITAKTVALASNAYPPLLKRLNHFVVPVYDYVLISEPLSQSQRAQIGWQGRQGLGDSGNQFHYSQITADGRILWGGYDAIYYPNNGFGSHLENNRPSYERLAAHFFQTFPQLNGLRFTHAWGGAIDTSSRFSAFWGKAHGGKTAYALGYTGLGVGASRFGAQVMLDLLHHQNNEITQLEMVRQQPFPFPPEPLRSPIINLTRWSLAQADQHQGQRNLWLKLLDAVGLGFDS